MDPFMARSVIKALQHAIQSKKYSNRHAMKEFYEQINWRFYVGFYSFS